MVVGEWMGGPIEAPPPSDSMPTRLCFQFSQLSPFIQKAALLQQRRAKEPERIMG